MDPRGEEVGEVGKDASRGEGFGEGICEPLGDKSGDGLCGGLYASLGEGSTYFGFFPCF